MSLPSIINFVRAYIYNAHILAFNGQLNTEGGASARNLCHADTSNPKTHCIPCLSTLFLNIYKLVTASYNARKLGVIIMGGFASKKKSNDYEEYVRSLIEEIRVLKGEMNEMMCVRKKESRAHEGDLMAYAFKEAEWKQERKKLKEKVKKLKKRMDEKEEKIRGIKDVMVNGERSEKDWQFLGTTSSFVEQMREERAWRDEAVEKWKRLYLAIKTELDDLLHKTDRGDGLYGRTEEAEMIEELREDIKAKEEMMEVLKSRIATMENQIYKREREIDILKQSLRIMSSKKATHKVWKTIPKTAFVKQIREV
ncbi:hypothetical protein CFOL_v3_13954 [Cephalotus follicularis]|uniref:Uncharacterized protein n=1 Tax=Cephalotus follicularis TaxID=3775 RepID=A0A1Q3BQX6_CEPFO|nr:hypothetical protein CFOL_v3_13954 [Cephalotus follicularis]